MARPLRRPSPTRPWGGALLGGGFKSNADITEGSLVDYDHTAAGSDFWQPGVGAEAGARCSEVHANDYIPQSDSNTLNRQTDTFAQSTTRRFTRTRAGAPFVTANGNAVQNFSRAKYHPPHHHHHRPVRHPTGHQHATTTPTRHLR